MITLDWSAIGHQFFNLAAATVLCSLLGIERHFRHKNAGLKTHALVGMGACLFTIVSAYGFDAVLGPTIHLDPSRVAAQIVSGIGFIGAGVIFVDHNSVRGLTTAATVWLSAALGMACGASLVPAAVMVLLLHYFVVCVLGPLLARFSPLYPTNRRFVISYAGKRGVLPQIMLHASRRGFKVMVEAVKHLKAEPDREERVQVVMRCEGGKGTDSLVEALSQIEGVFYVEMADGNELE